MNVNRFKRIAFREYKDIHQKIFFKKAKEKKLMFIVGCQRSGTTILSEVLEKDFRTKVYKEVHSSLSTGDSYGLRLDPLPEVQKNIYSNNAGIIVAKPLVESQYTSKLLKEFSEAKAVWLFRDFRDVISSDLKKFGASNSIENLKKVLFEKEYTWRSEKITSDTKNLIQKYYDENMSAYDAGALFWYSRNILFFDQHLYNENRVRLCSYQDLVSKPEKTVRHLYQFINAIYPKKEITSSLHSNSLRKGAEITLQPEIEDICTELFEKLNSHYGKQEY